MRVALDEQIFAVQYHGGISRLFYQLAKAFISDPSLGVQLSPLNAPIVNEYLLADSEASTYLNVSPAHGPYSALTRYLRKVRSSSDADVVHNTFYLPRGLRSGSDSKRVVTVYDMIPELLPGTRRRLDFLTLKRQYVKRADHIICISESTRRDLLRVFPEVRTPISIAYPGVSSDFHPAAGSAIPLPTPYILHVGNRAGYKDAQTLLEAFTRLAARFPDHTLMLVGGGPLTKRETSIIRASGLQGRVQQVKLADSDVPSAYAQADVTVFPSRYEGFGLPAVEAMACGSPLILADTSSLPEIGGDAALYFPPGDVAVLTEQIAGLLSNATERRDRGAMGIQQAGHFTWSRYAQATAEAYQQALLGV